MAIIKHIASKNADYGAAERYLIYQHDEFTHKEILDENGRRILRDNYLIEGIHCTPDTYALECMKLNQAYRKNNTREEIKSHHYIISFDPRDRDENDLTPERAQQMGMEFAAKNFPGHQAIVCTHPDGHNSSGNIHVHIVINSLRKLDVERQDFMERPSDSRAGNKHHLSRDYLKYLKQETMELCQRENLYQVDLLSPAKVHVSEKEYWARRKGQAKLDEKNEQIEAAGLTPKTTVFETQKDTLRKAITQAMLQSKTLEEFQNILFQQYGIEVKESRGRFSYLHPDRSKPITSRQLGTDFGKEYIEQYISTHKPQQIDLFHTQEPKAKKPKMSKGQRAITKPQNSIRLITDLQNCIKAQENRFYAQKVKVGNLQLMAKTVAYLQENGIGTIEELQAVLSEASTLTSTTHDQLMAIEKRLKAVNMQIKNTGQYFGNKKVYDQYRKAKDKAAFLEEHRAEIMLFEAAKAALKEAQGDGKLPSMKMLKAEKEELVQKKNDLYETYSFARARSRELQTIHTNVQSILGSDLSTTQEAKKER